MNCSQTFCMNLLIYFSCFFQSKYVQSISKKVEGVHLNFSNYGEEQSHVLKEIILTLLQKIAIIILIQFVINECTKYLFLKHIHIYVYSRTTKKLTGSWSMLPRKISKKLLVGMLFAQLGLVRGGGAIGFSDCRIGLFLFGLRFGLRIQAKKIP